jgi:preprotein translocase SecE subunit
MPGGLGKAVPAPIAGRTEGMTTWVTQVWTELRKCAWPTREETMRLTTVIIAISIVVGLLLGTFDALFAALMKGLLTGSFS